MSTLKNIQIVSEPMTVYLDGRHEPFIPPSVTDGRAAKTILLEMIFKHIAEFHGVMLDILVKKYGLDYNQIVNDVHADMRAREHLAAPRLNGFGAVTQDDLDKVIAQMGGMALDAPAAAAGGGAAAPAVSHCTSVPSAAEAPPKPAKRVVKKKVKKEE